MINTSPSGGEPNHSTTCGSSGLKDIPGNILNLESPAGQSTTYIC